MFEENVKTGKQKVIKGLRSNIFDIIAAIIIVAIIAANMNVFDFNTYSWKELCVALIEWVPFFAAAMLLNTDLYQKGVFIGKLTESFKIVVSSYSAIVENLTGEQIKTLPEFCDYKNNEVLRRKQMNILKKVSISMEIFEEGTKEMKPLKQLSKKELLRYYNKDTVKIIMQAKKVTIVGLKVNTILGNMDIEDDTDIGMTETQLFNKTTAKSVITYLIWTVVFGLIGIKDISTWGWSGLILIIFKTAWVFAKSYISYFKGYNDIVINLQNHIVRKTDILKEFSCWNKIASNKS